MKLIRLLPILSICSLFSCQEANPRQIKEWLAMSDTLLQNRINRTYSKLDSACLIRSDSFYKVAYDSIYLQRSKEIQYLLDSIKANEKNK